MTTQTEEHMSEEYVWKETTGNIALFEMKANHNITFHNGNKQVGVLDFNGPEMTFSGDMDESAKIFFDWIARSFKARLDQERADAQRTWVELTKEDMDWLHANTPCIEGNYGYRFIKYIEAKIKEKNT